MTESQSEIDVVRQRVTATLTASIVVAGQVAETIVAVQANQLRRKALRTTIDARQERERVSAMRAAHSAVWQPALRRDWWNRATVDDISKAWQAAAVWHRADPRAAEARQVMTERLAQRGIDVQPEKMDAGDRQWLAVALQLAEQEKSRATTAGSEGNDRSSVDEPRFTHTDADRDRIAEEVRQHCSRDKADQLLNCQAWPALAYRLHDFEHEGGSVDVALQRLPTLSNAHTPAALAEWSVQHMINERRNRDGQITEPETKQLTDARAALPRTEPSASVASDRRDNTSPAAGIDDGDRTRMADYVRQLDNDDLQQRLLTSPAWPALAHRMHQFEQGGGDLPAALRRLGTLDRARDAGAVAASSLKKWHQTRQGRADQTKVPETPEARSAAIVAEQIPRRTRDAMADAVAGSGLPDGADKDQTAQERSALLMTGWVEQER